MPRATVWRPYPCFARRPSENARPVRFSQKGAMEEDRGWVGPCPNLPGTVRFHKQITIFGLLAWYLTIIILSEAQVDSDR